MKAKSKAESKRIERAIKSASMRGFDPHDNFDACSDAYARNLKRALRREAECEAQAEEHWWDREVEQHYEDEDERIHYGRHYISRSQLPYEDKDAMLQRWQEVCRKQAAQRQRWEQQRPIWEVEGEGEAEPEQMDWINWAGRK